MSTNGLTPLDPSSSPVVASVPRFQALDGLRGILAVVVAIYHTYWLSWPNAVLLTENAVVILDLFFVFSGFLMYTLYADKIASGNYAAGKFMLRRVARLFPLHFFTLILFALWTLMRTGLHVVGIADGDMPILFASGSDVSFGNFLANLFLLNSIGLTDELSFNAPSWTVGAEFLAYAVFAITIFWTARFLKSKLGMLCLSIFVAMLYFHLSKMNASLDITYNNGFLRCLAGFYVGVFAAIVRQNGWLVISKRHTFIEISTMIVCLSFVVFMSGQNTFFVAPYLFLFVIVFMQDGGWISKILAAKPFLWLARISYSVYLNHFLIAIGFGMVYRFVSASVFPEWEPGMVAGTLLLVPYIMTVCVFSELTCRYVENPGAKLINNMSNKVLSLKRRPSTS